MASGVSITENRQEWDRLARSVQEITGGSSKVIGIGVFGRSGSDIVKIASAHEFGATIRHPGGTAFGFNTQRDIQDNRIRFLRSGEGQVVLGETGPHTIKIPKRSFLRSWADQKRSDIGIFVSKEMRKFILGKQSYRKSLRRIGLFGVAGVRNKITRGPFRPLKPATIRRKRSSRPLIDTGRMRQSITFAEVPRGQRGI